MPESRSQGAQPGANSRLAAIFLGDAGALAPLVQALERVPADLWPRLAEVAVLLRSESVTDAPPAELAPLAQRWPNLRVHGDPRRYGHGGRRKIAFEYALQHGFDHVVVLEPDARYAPERIEDLWRLARDGAKFVVGSGRAAPLARIVHNFVLDLDVADYASPFRLIA